MVNRSTKRVPDIQRLLLADDHKIVRQGLRSLLEKHRGYQCVGEADDGQEAVRLARELRPDIVILESMMPKLNGIDATLQIKSELPATNVVVLSSRAPSASILRALQAGASAYLLKDSAFEELSTALATVARGDIYLSAAITKSAVFRNRTNSPVDEYERCNEQLTKREIQVLQLIADGSSTKEIAARLGVSVKTIETHRKQVMDKLGIRSVAGLTKYCIREGLTSV